MATRTTAICGCGRARGQVGSPEEHRGLVAGPRRDARAGGASAERSRWPGQRHRRSLGSRQPGGARRSPGRDRVSKPAEERVLGRWRRWSGCDPRGRPASGRADGRYRCCAGHGRRSDNRDPWLGGIRIFARGACSGDRAPGHGARSSSPVPGPSSQTRSESSSRPYDHRPRPRARAADPSRANTSSPRRTVRRPTIRARSEHSQSVATAAEHTSTASRVTRAATPQLESPPVPDLNRNFGSGRGVRAPK